MAKLSPPQVSVQLVPVLVEEDLKKLLADCRPGLRGQKVPALIRLLVDTGMRRG